MTKIIQLFSTFSLALWVQLENLTRSTIAQTMAAPKNIPTTGRGRLEVASSALLFTVIVPAAAMAAGKDEGLTRVRGIITRATTVIVLLIAALGVLMLAIAGFTYATAGGNAQRVQSAQTTAKNVIIGFIIAAVIYIVPRVVLDIVGAGANDSATNKQIKDLTPVAK